MTRITADLVGAPTAPGVQLVLLVELLRRALGDDVLIELSGVTPMIRASLVAFGVPGNVIVTDSRGRSWAGDLGEQCDVTVRDDTLTSGDVTINTRL